MSTKAIAIAVAAVFAAWAAASPVPAQTRGNTGPRATHAALQTRGMSADKYVQSAAMSDMFETQSSKLALQRSQNPDVKAFAQRMIDDHTQSTQKLTGLLQSASVSTAPPPRGLDGTHQHMLQQLQSASGGQFDRLYMQMQVKGHQEALKVQEGYSRRGDNDQLKTFASDASSMVQDHLSQAQQVLRGLSSRRGAQRGAGTTMQ